jgi:hypothetical protein
VVTATVSSSSVVKVDARKTIRAYALTTDDEDPGHSSIVDSSQMEHMGNEIETAPKRLANAPKEPLRCRRPKRPSLPWDSGDPGLADMSARPLDQPPTLHEESTSAQAAPLAPNQQDSGDVDDDSVTDNNRQKQSQADNDGEDQKDEAGEDQQDESEDEDSKEDEAEREAGDEEQHDHT